MVGRQQGRPSSVSLHINATLEDLSPAGHKGQPFTFETQPHIKWKSKEEYMINNANVTKENWSFIPENWNKAFSSSR